MKMRLTLLAVALLATGALAIQQLDLNVSPRLMALTGGLVIAPKSLLTTDTAINKHRVTRELGGTLTAMFYTDAGLGCTGATTVSGDTIAGVRAGDICLVAQPSTAHPGSLVSCTAATNQVILKHCAQQELVDAGSQTYNVRVISNQ